LDDQWAKVYVDNNMGLTANGFTTLGNTEASVFDSIVRAVADTQ
jgi:hypothetical protein